MSFTYHRILFHVALITLLQFNVEAEPTISETFRPSLQAGDVISISGHATGKKANYIRLRSPLGSCGDNQRPGIESLTSPISCSPLILKLMASKHKIQFLQRGQMNENRDTPIKAKTFRALKPGFPFNINVMVTYTGFDVTFNDESPVSFINREKFGNVVFIRANSGNYSSITLKRGAKIPLNEPDCGVRGLEMFRSKWARITNGLDADPGAYPWQVALRRKIVYTWSPYAHMCGGSLIRKCWVVTAAHCVQYVRRYKMNFEIRVGDLHNGDDSMYFMDEDQQTFDIEEVYTHPNYTDRPVPRNDIALIKLAPKNGECAVYGEFVKSVCLPEPLQDMFPTETECHISGWGAKNWTDRPRNYPNILQYGIIKLHDFNICQNMYGRDETTNATQISEGMLCAGSPGIDTCQGDSGGPLVCERPHGHFEHSRPFVLWGVTSWGHGCANSKKPGVYADVARYINWITNIIAGKQ